MDAEIARVGERDALDGWGTPASVPGDVPGTLDDERGSSDPAADAAISPVTDPAAELVAVAEHARRVAAWAQSAESIALAQRYQLALEASSGMSAAARMHELGSAADEMAATLAVSPHAMQRRMETAHCIMTRFPATQAAWSGGRIGARHVDILARHGAPIDDPDRTRAYEAAVLEEAERLTPNQLEPVAKRLAIMALDWSLDDAYQEAKTRRRVRIVDFDDGMSELRAELPTWQAHAIYDKLTQEAAALREAADVRASGEPADAGQAEDPGQAANPGQAADPGADQCRGTAQCRDEASCRGEAPCPSEASCASEARYHSEASDPGATADPAGSPADACGAESGTATGHDAEGNPEDEPDRRSFDAIRADLLAEMLLAGDPWEVADARADGRPLVQARVLLEVPVTSLAGRSQAPAELLGIGPVPVEQARELCTERPELQRLLTDPITQVPLAVESYRPSAALRATLLARDATCRFPGCRRTVWRCDLDHTIDAALGGPTSIGNLAHLCRAHHIRKHDPSGRWTPRQAGGGVIEWTSPTGRVFADHPQRRAPSFGPADSG